ncbi:hypothetical protein EYZ11_004969 [Aspergillus tanneri]|uniref:GST N-terminal domain-containing protein n=1 Tax=Aspergillus tanneri TaxID=1220188 RepID=A0A4V6RQV0_9EURO|nr:hypothetical protein EYZ11_004969 [Aspergillus tanneri]
MALDQSWPAWDSNQLVDYPGTTGLPYEQVTFPVLDVKTPEYVAINPNGRLPALYDPNIDLTLWESGTIVEYLMQRYYKEHPLSFPQGSNKASITQRWLFFQTSGQTPYFGQALWFKKFHPERIPSLAGQSADNGGPWLVGQRYFYAELACLSCQIIVTRVIQSEDGYTVEDFPHVRDWLNRMLERPSVQRAMENVQPIR